ncbi:MAG TPA: NUDIX hydrolase, partial [Micromonosporaceae bacterium]|nr:NUDIX hydrolase [Micromonosporaceae bacterium]
MAAVGSPAVVRAAGGVVHRPGPPGSAEPAGDVEICLVHRPRYDDWSLPKGKLAPGEPALAAAVREVWEETGVRAAAQTPLPSVHYLARGLPKTVDYWTMRVLSLGEFVPGDEVDEVRWVSIVDARDLLSYEHDLEVVDAYAALPPVTGVVLLIRHASAGRRGSWPGPDKARPLDDTGVAQAEALAELLALFAPTRLVSASPRR